MEKVKKSLYFLWKWKDFFGVVIFFSLVIANCFFDNPIVLLDDENNVFYFFSTGAQVLAGLFGLTLTGYIFFSDHLDKMVRDDETLFDIVKLLKDDYFKTIIKMCIVLIISLSLAFLNIAYAKSPNINVRNSFNFIGAFFILLEIFYIVLFIVRVTNPSKFDKSNQRLLKNEIVGKSEQVGKLEDFFEQWKKLESLIDKLYKTNNSNLLYYSQYQNMTPLIIKVKDLINSEVISADLLSEIDEMRRKRNIIVHGNDSTVYIETIEKLKSIIKKIEKSAKK